MALFDMKQDLAKEQAELQRQEQIPITTTPIRGLSARTQVGAQGGLTNQMRQAFQSKKVDKAAAGVRGEFMQMMMDGTKAYDKFVNSAVSKYGEGVINFIPPKEMSMKDGEFYPPDAYTKALTGVSKYIPLYEKEQKLKNLGIAKKDYESLMQKELGADKLAQGAMQAGGPEGAQKYLEGQQTASNRQKELDAAGQAKLALQRLKSAEKKRTELSKLADVTKLADEAQEFGRDYTMLIAGRDKLVGQDGKPDKTNPEYIRFDRLAKEALKQQKAYTIAATEAEFATPTKDEGFGKVLSSARKEVGRREEAQDYLSGLFSQVSRSDKDAVNQLENYLGIRLDKNDFANDMVDKNSLFRRVQAENLAGRMNPEAVQNLRIAVGIEDAPKPPSTNAPSGRNISISRGGTTAPAPTVSKFDAFNKGK